MNFTHSAASRNSKPRNSAMSFAEKYSPRLASSSVLMPLCIFAHSSSKSFVRSSFKLHSWMISA